MTEPPEPRQPIPPGKRKRLQQAYQHGSKMMAAGNFDYAHECFTQCVVGDPANLLYTQNLLGNLQKKYNNNKKGAKMASVRSAGSKGSVKKSALQKDWTAVIKSGIEVLALNPWDTSTLLAMAAASEKLENDEVELAYLRAALDADINDVDINRQAGRALARQSQFDQAIICWNRVLNADKNDDEAKRAVANLTVERTITKGGYEGAESTTDVRAGEEEPAVGLQLTPERRLEKEIEKNPTEISNYLQLAELHRSKENFEDAEKWYTQALEASGGDVNVRERLEDFQLSRRRDAVDIAEKRLEAESTEANQNQLKRLKAELNQAELEIFSSRSERYPSNLQLKFEVGLRLKRAGKYPEAIKPLQEARNEPRSKGLVLLNLGECFQQIKQFKLAMSNYAEAVDAIPDTDPDNKKLALYRAGLLAMVAFKDLDAAENYFTTLAGHDFGYKDVAARLDKINQMRNDG